MFGSYIGIIAKDNSFFYLIEVKTMMSKYNISRKWTAKQLLKQKEGLKRVVALFSDKPIQIKLILIEYIRDINKLLIKSIDDSGKIINFKEIVKADDCGIYKN